MAEAIALPLARPTSPSAAPGAELAAQRRMGKNPFAPATRALGKWADGADGAAP